MKSEIKYIELKSNYSHNGPAWIGLVFFSKTGKTIYFNGKAFQRIGSSRIRGNFYDIETMEEYWISGVKKNMSDRHKFGNGKIQVERRIIEQYLSIIECNQLEKTRFEVCNVLEEIPVEKITEFLNSEYETKDFDSNRRFLNPKDFSDKELNYFTEYFEYDADNLKHIKNRKLAREKYNQLKDEQERRKEFSKNLC